LTESASKARTPAINRKPISGFLQGASIYLLAAGCLVLAPWSENIGQMFALNRNGLLNHEYWRLWTGHLVHNSWAHLALNVAALALLQQLFGADLQKGKWFRAYVVIAPLISILWLARGSDDTVYGLSALLHGLYAFAACLAISRDKLLAGVVLGILGAKLLWEQTVGPSETTADLIAMPIAINTHLYGAVCGVILGLLVIAYKAIRDD